MILNWPTFVLQRRINQPLGAVEQVVCDPNLLSAGSVLALDNNGMYVRLDRPFGVTFPPFGLDGASWCAPASVHTRRGRSVVRFELEINAWDFGSTELLVRPRARRPYRWSGGRLRQYFRVAHATADALTLVLGSRALDAPKPRPRIPSSVIS